jgi:ATP-dependent RNA helicase RhlE
MTQSTSVGPRFDVLGINPKILAILRSNSFLVPTPIQNQCIPQALEGKDIVGIARTGTGKTLAFGVPILQNLIKNEGQALVLVPTRELAIQAEEMLYKIGSSLNIRTAVIIGGASFDRQVRSIKRNPHIIIATPGRLLDHLNRRIFNLNKIKIIVLDEADHMLDIGFLPDIKNILSLSPKERQTLLFSATMPNEIVEIASKFMKIPVRIEVSPEGTAALGVKQELFILNNKLKPSLLEKILSDNKGTILVFTKTKHSAKKITEIVSSMGHTSAEIHSNRSLYQRKEALSGFKSGKYRVLVATDIAARGIDVSNISIVVNYDLPQNPGDYVHRIGRTGRANATGRAISFVTPDQRFSVKKIERLIKKNISIATLPKLSGLSDSVLKIIHSKEEFVEPKKDNYRPAFKARTQNNYNRRGKNTRFHSKQRLTR